MASNIKCKQIQTSLVRKKRIKRDDDKIQMQTFNHVGEIDVKLISLVFILINYQIFRNIHISLFFYHRHTK